MAVIEVKLKDHVATIDGHICTFDTKETRTRIQEWVDSYGQFFLPSNYKVKFLTSDFSGTVAKISLA